MATNAAFAGVYLTVPQALGKIFSNPVKIEERRAFLKKEQIEKVRTLAGSDVSIDSGLVTYYQGYDHGILMGTAYLDTHTVRTLDETILAVINPDNTVREINILRFNEPPEYRAPERWLAQFKGRKLDKTLSLKGNVHGITGASLTARSLTISLRRILALHQVLQEKLP